MIDRSLCTLLFVAACLSSPAQYPNARSLHGMGREHVLTDDGGRVVFGEALSLSWLHSSTVSRLDAQDQLLWSRAFLITGDIGHVEPLNDGSYMVHTSIVDPDSTVDRPAMFHLDNAGDLLDAWYFEHGPATYNYTHSARSADGANLLMGSSPTFVPPFNRDILVKADDNGNVMWALGITGGNFIIPRVVGLPDGRILWASLVGDLIMLEADGSVAWTAHYDYGTFTATMRPNGNYLVLGIDNAIHATTVLELDHDGDFVQLSRYGHAGLISDGWASPDRGPSMALAPNGRMLIRSVPGSGPFQAQYLLTDTLGEPVWGMNAVGEGHGMVSFANDSLMLSSTRSESGSADAILRRALVNDGFTGCLSATVPYRSDSILTREPHNIGVTPIAVSSIAFTPTLPVQPVFMGTACGSVSTPDQTTEVEFAVSPNPVDGMCQVSRTRPGESLTVNDLSGRVLMMPTVSAQGTIDLSALNAGVYVLQVSGAAGTRAVRIVRSER